LFSEACTTIPVETRADQESSTNQNGDDAPKRGQGTMVGEITQVSLALIDHDQYPEDWKAERQDNQAYSGRDPLQRVLIEEPIGRCAFRRSFLSEFEAKIVSGVHIPFVPLII